MTAIIKNRVGRPKIKTQADKSVKIKAETYNLLKNLSKKTGKTIIDLIDIGVLLADFNQQNLDK